MSKSEYLSVQYWSAPSSIKHTQKVWFASYAKHFRCFISFHITQVSDFHFSPDSWSATSWVLLKIPFLAKTLESKDHNPYCYWCSLDDCFDVVMTLSVRFSHSEISSTLLTNLWASFFSFSRPQKTRLKKYEWYAAHYVREDLMGGVSKHTGFFSGILCLLFSFWG